MKLHFFYKMCNKIKCVGQYTVDLLNNDIVGMCTKNVQTGCTGYKHSCDTDDGE